MSAAVAIGDPRRLDGYALAGADVLGAATEAEVEAAWARVGEDTRLVVLTAEAHAVVAERLAERDTLVWAVMPS